MKSCWEKRETNGPSTFLPGVQLVSLHGCDRLQAGWDLFGQAQVVDSDLDVSGIAI